MYARFEEHLLLNALHEPAIIVNQACILIAMNQAWREASQLRVKLNEFWPEMQEGMSLVISGARSLYKKVKACPSDGGELIYSVSITPIKDNQNRVAGALVRFVDMTEQRKLEQTLQLGAEQYRLIADNSHDMIKIIDVHGRIEYASPSHQRILGYTEEIDIYEHVHPEDRLLLRELVGEVVNTGDSKIIECRKLGKNGDWIWLETAVSPVRLDGSIQNLLFIAREISERKQYEYELERMAYHDHLTGLYNRRKMRMLMDETLEDAMNGKEKFAFLIMDLDKFKWINDTHGHDVGDLVLKEFAKRLLQNKSDTDFVGRLSGDEFAVILRNVDGKESVDYFVQRIRESFLEPCKFHEVDSFIPIKTSIGYAIYPEYGDTVKGLFKKADIALYKEKRKRHQLRLRKAGDLRVL